MIRSSTLFGQATVIVDVHPGCHSAICSSIDEVLRLVWSQCRSSDGYAELVAESTGKQISSRLLSMRSANALLELPQVRHPMGCSITMRADMISLQACLHVICLQSWPCHGCYACDPVALHVEQRAGICILRQSPSLGRA